VSPSLACCVGEHCWQRTEGRLPGIFQEGGNEKVAVGEVVRKVGEGEENLVENEGSGNWPLVF